MIRMVYDEHCADRIQHILLEQHIEFVEKKMMGGLIFMINDKIDLFVIIFVTSGRGCPNCYKDKRNNSWK